MFNLLHIRELQFQITLRFHLTPIRVARVKENKIKQGPQLLVWLWGKGSTAPSLLRGVQTGTATVEICVVLP